MTTWSSRADITLGTISAIQAGLTVRLVMTARASLMPCRPEDPVDAVMADNVGQFSFLSVENEGRICGLYRAEQWFGREELPSRPIDQDFEPLTEDNLVGSDASILKFLARAVEHPTRLVVSDTEVVGLVCLSDVQKLPVRAALFSVLTALKMAMARRIEETWPDDPDGWLGLLSDATSSGSAASAPARVKVRTMRRIGDSPCAAGGIELAPPYRHVLAQAQVSSRPGVPPDAGPDRRRFISAQ